jgi:hypothetical protein
MHPVSVKVSTSFPSTVGATALATIQVVTDLPCQGVALA